MNFEKLTRYLDSLGEKNIPGREVTIWQDHKPIYRHLSGFNDEALASPMTGNEVYWLYSTSKLYLVAAIMQLKEAGKICLDDPACKYLPFLENMMVREGNEIVPARRKITIRHLLSMQGGFDYQEDSPAILNCIKETGGQATTMQMVEAIAGQPLNFHPGDHFLYSLCHDVLGAVVEAVSGMKLGDYYEKHIFAPLGMKDISFDLTPEKRKNVAAKFQWDNDTHTCTPIDRYYCEDLLTPNYQSAGGGLCGTVADYMIFADALAHEGVGRNGYRVLSKQSIDEIRVNQQTGLCWDDFLEYNRPGYGYGLGVRTKISAEPGKSPVGEFGWESYAGAWVMIDTEKRLSAFYAQHVILCQYSYDVIHPTIRDLIYEGLEAE